MHYCLPGYPPFCSETPQGLYVIDIFLLRPQVSRSKHFPLLRFSPKDDKLPHRVVQP